MGLLNSEESSTKRAKSNRRELYRLFAPNWSSERSRLSVDRALALGHVDMLSGQTDRNSRNMTLTKRQEQLGYEPTRCDLS